MAGLTEGRRDGSSPHVTAELLRELGCGQVVGRYQLLRRIATGGMAEVYVARPLDGLGASGARVAIKKILPQFSSAERFIDMLVDEAKITVALTHPNIASVYELGVHGPDYFLVMEYVDGRPLNRIMQRIIEHGRTSVPITHAVYVISEIAKGLDHAHRQSDPEGRPLGIVHRDVSPQNVLTSYDGDVKLIDFGIARAAGRINQTSTGVIKGKLRYLAPEIATGENPDARADVFCCGIVLFEMLTGEALFSPKSDFEAIEMATNARVRSPRSRNANVPMDLDAIVMKALRRDREERHPSALDLHTELRRFLDRVAPQYTARSLGAFVADLFRDEIAQDHETDVLAEAIADEPDDDFGSEDPTMASRSAHAAATGGGYRSVVTRLEIGRSMQLLQGADGGAPMAVVPAELVPASIGPPAKSTTTQAPRGHIVANTAVAFRSVREIDHRSKPAGSTERLPSALPARTESGPPPPRTGASALARPRSQSISQMILRRGSRWGLVASVLVVASVGATIWWLVSPASVERDGTETTSTSVPATLTGTLASTSPRDRDAPDASEPGPSLGEIRLDGVEGARVQSSHGRVVTGASGVSIRDVPIQIPVAIRVDFGGGVPRVRTEVTLESAEPISIRVTPPKPPARGTLIVSSQPQSTIFVNGRKQGQTPLTLRLPPGRHRVVAKTTHGASRRWVRLQAGKTERLRFRW